MTLALPRILLAVAVVVLGALLLWPAEPPPPPAPEPCQCEVDLCGDGDPD